MTQPGETDGYDLRRHLETMTEYAPQIRFDYVIVNDRAISEDQAHLYGADGAYQVVLDGVIDKVDFDPETEVVRAHLLDEGEMVRHNSDRLAQAVIGCVEKARARLVFAVES